MRYTMLTMTEVNFTQESYVIAGKIPVPVQVDDVIGEYDVIFSADFPIQRPIVVGCPGNKTVLLICWSEEDAEDLVGYSHPQGITFDRYVKQPIMRWPTLQVDKSIIDAMREHDDLSEFKKTLNQAQIQLHEGDNYLRTPSRLQIDYSKILIATYEQKYGLSDVSKAENDEKLLQLSISEVDELTRELLDIVKNMDIIQLTLNGGGLEYKDGTVTVSASKPEGKAIANELISFIVNAKKKEKEKIEISVKDQTNAANCCREVNESLGKCCCNLAASKDFIIIYGDTFDEIQKAKQLVSRELSISRRKLRSSVSTQAESLSEEVNGLELSGNSRKVASNLQYFNWVRDAKQVKSFNTPEGIQVHAYSADVLNLPVDGIVLAADDQLKFTGGIGKTVSKVAGPKFKQECKDYMEAVGDIPTGHVAVTGAGSLQYDCIIQAVVPPWSFYKPYTLERVQEAEQHLLTALMQSFFKAETRGLETVGIVGTLSDLPEGLSVHQCVRATMEYSAYANNCTTALKEIHFIDSDVSNLALLQVKLATFINEGKDPNYSVQNFVKVRILPGKSRRSSKRYSKGDD